MSISCGCDYGDDEGWKYHYPQDFNPLSTKRARRCCSCGTRIAVGDECIEFERNRQSDGYIEERIYGDEVHLASWFMCEECGGVFFSVVDAGYCVYLTKGEDIRKIMKTNYRD